MVCKGIGILAMLAALSQAATVMAKEDPDLGKPQNTTGGQIGFGAGLAVGAYYGGPAGAATGAASGALVGHGVDRVVTHVANDVTGPAFHKLEKQSKKVSLPPRLKTKSPKW